MKFFFFFQIFKWYFFFYFKYSKNKFEIRLVIYLEDDKSGEQEIFFKVKDVFVRRMLYMYRNYKLLFIYNMFIQLDI